MSISKSQWVVTLFCLFALLCSDVVISKQFSDSTSKIADRFFSKSNFVNSLLIINVSDYGGATDQERIQNALNDVPPDGAIVLVPAGVWEACNLTAVSRTIILGENGTVLRRPANTTAPFITFANQSGFAVINMTFDGQNIPEATGINVANGNDFQISSNRFENIGKNAVYVSGTSWNFVIENNFLNNTNVAPILVFGTPGSREISQFTIANNTLIDSVNNGKIGVAFAADGIVADNLIRGCSHGIGTRCVTNITIRNNRIEDCLSYGIYLGTQPGDYGSSGIIIADNYITNSSTGIARYYASGSVSEVTVRNNTMVFNEQSDIYADFQASFANNTLTSKAKLRLLIVPLLFSGNVDVNGTLIMPADVTNDGKVDMRDLGIVARLYGTSRNSENWNPDADIIQDGVIDMRDIGFAAKCFCSYS